MVRKNSLRTRRSRRTKRRHPRRHRANKYRFKRGGRDAFRRVTVSSINTNITKGTIPAQLTEVPELQRTITRPISPRPISPRPISPRPILTRVDSPTTPQTAIEALNMF